METIRLSSGYDIPRLGLGTWQLTGSACRESVREALTMGYTHIDTAVGYGNHREVGEGVRESGVNREGLFITTKISTEGARHDRMIGTAKRSLEELGMDYVDLLLIHWPTKKVPFAETLGAMKELVDAGSVRSIGISNFNARIAAEAARVSEVPIVTNQVEFHPLLFQKELQQACENLGMKITAYSPLARGEVLRNAEVREVAEKHGISAAQTAIAWLLHKGIIVIPKASSADHLESNLRAESIALDAEDVTAIDGIGERMRIVDGSWVEYPF